jgi:hypothetical protein
VGTIGIAPSVIDAARHRTKNTTLAPTSSTLKSNVQLALGSIGVMASSQLQSATKAHDRLAKESHCVAAD